MKLGWIPIELAPRNNKYILLQVNNIILDIVHIKIGRWSHVLISGVKKYTWVDDRFEQIGDGLEVEIKNWMPLPNPYLTTCKSSSDSYYYPLCSGISFTAWMDKVKNHIGMINYNDLANWSPANLRFLMNWDFRDWHDAGILPDNAAKYIKTLMKPF